MNERTMILSDRKNTKKETTRLPKTMGGKLLTYLDTKLDQIANFIFKWTY